MVTKAEILASAKDITGTVEFPEHDWEPEIHALTDAQFILAQSKMLSGQTGHPSARNQTLSIDVGKLIESEFEARVYIVSKGLVEQWSEAEVKKIPIPGAINKLSDAILALGHQNIFSGLDRGAQSAVGTFRSE